MTAETMPITHEQAATAVRRLIKGSFRRDGEFLSAEDRPRFSIPCRPDHDDDTVASAYVKQQDSLASTHTRAMEALAEAEKALEGVIRVADRATVEFDAAKAALASIAAAKGGKP